MALCILSVVQYLRASSGEASALCLATFFDEVDFEERLRVARNKTVHKDRMSMLTDGIRTNLLFDIMAQYFRKANVVWTSTLDIIHDSSQMENRIQVTIDPALTCWV